LRGSERLYEGTEIEADPLHFFDRDGGIYLIYRSTKHGNIRTLAVERILDISETVYGGSTSA
jgi:beta-xylosidase